MIFPAYNDAYPSDPSDGLGSWASADTASGFLNALDQSSANDTQVTLSALSQLQAASDTFQDALEELLPPGLIGSSTASSNNPSVVSAAAQSNAPTGTYNITVNSLAQAQALQSASYATPDNDVVGSGNLTITLGTYDADSNTFTPGSQAPTTVSLDSATLDDVASAINTAGGGVTAAALAVSGGYGLVISGTGTGANQAFEVQVDDPSLSGLSFDPTNPQSSGLTQTQIAQDASLLVNGAAVTSGSNSGLNIAPGLSVNLLQTGNSVVTSAPSSAAIQSQAQSLISAYNAVQSSLASASSDGAADEVAGPYADALTQAASAEYDSGDSLLSLPSQIGLNLQFGGGASPGATSSSLSLNPGALDTATSEDASGTLTLLGSVIQAFDSIADSYGGGGGVLQGTEDTYQSALYSDQLVAAQPSQQPLPTISQLVANQSSQDGLDSAQIQSAQQYARAFGPLQASAWTSSLLTEVYTPYSMPTSLLSVLA